LRVNWKRKMLIFCNAIAPILLLICLFAVVYSMPNSAH
jgi:hypothetical protein